MIRRVWEVIALPLLAFVLALIVGAIVILGSQLLLPDHQFDPFEPITAYQALFVGAFGSFDAIVATLVASVPLVLAGLSVGFGFKAGLFNIGGQGQFLLGALGAVAVGVAVADQPPVIAITLAVIAGMLAGALWGFIPGVLKAWSGAHEVVTTIMLNYIGISLLATLVSGPLKVPGSPSPITHPVGNAAFPIILGRDGHLGIVVALVATVLVAWFLFRTTRGFEVRTVGISPDAARYAGMRPKLIIVFTMSMCGLLAGLAGACVVLGVTHSMTSSFGTSVGFDAIAVALVARSNPYGIVLSALLFGAMRAGGGLMQIQAQIPPELVDVLQATILLALIASGPIRKLFRLRGVKGAGFGESISRSYSEAVR